MFLSFAGWIKALVDKGNKTEKAAIASTMMQKKANGVHFDLVPDSMQAQQTVTRFQEKYFDEKAFGSCGITW